MPASPDSFKAGMRRFPAAVSVITTVHEGERAGMTATAVMSMTAEPPQVAVALNKNASALPAIQGAGKFVVNTLAYGQEPIGARFAGAGGATGEARFDGAVWTRLETGAPVLEGAAVSFDCTLASVVEVDTHVLLVGLVEAVQVGPEERQLLYVEGAWASLMRATSADAEAYLQATQRANACIDEAVAAGGRPAEQLERFVRRFAVFHLDLSHDIDAMLGLEPYLKAEDLARIKQAKRAFDDRLVALLEAGAASGDFRIDNASLAAQTITGMTSWIGRRPGSAGLDQTEVADRISDLTRVLVGADH